MQKDVWHTLDRAAQTVTDLERIALRKLEDAHKMGEELADLPWGEAAFNAWAEADEQAEKLVVMSGQLCFWYGCLCDALEIVNWRSGEIRDRQINAWLLEATLKGLRQLDHPRVKALVTYLQGQKDEFLSLAWPERIVMTRKASGWLVLLSIVVALCLAASVSGLIPTVASTPSVVIRDVRVTDVRDTTFAVSWVTDQAATGEVHYGTDPGDLSQIAHDVRGEGTSDDTHYVTLLALLPNTTYYFDVVSDGTTDDNGGGHYTVTTGPTLGLPTSDTVYGQVFQENGTTPAEGTVVYITLFDDNGSGSSGQAAELSGMADSSGYWSANLGSARTADLGGHFNYSASGDRVELMAQGAGDGTDSQTVDTSGDDPAPPMVLVPCAGDIDGDLNVTVADIQSVASRWGQSAGPPLDSDDDGVITVVDINAVGQRWRATCGS